MMAIFKPQATGAYHNHVLQETTDMKVQGTSDRNKNTWSVSKPPMKQLIIINIFMSRSLVTCFFTNPSDQKICASQIGSPSPRIGIKHTRVAKHLHNANGYSPRKRHFPYQGTFEDPFPFPQGRSFFSL